MSSSSSSLWLRKGLGLSRLAARGIASKAPKDPIGPMETVVGLTTFFLAFMIPSGWILANLESYKGRQ